MKITTGGTGLISSQSSMVASALGVGVVENGYGPESEEHYNMNYGWSWFQSSSLLYLAQQSFSTFTYNGVSVVPDQTYLIWQSSAPTYFQWIFTAPAGTPDFSDMWTEPMPYFAIEITNNNTLNPTKTFDLRQEGGVDGGGSQVQAFGSLNPGLMIKQYAPGGDGTNWPVSGTTTPSLGTAGVAGDHNLKNNYPAATRIRVWS